MHVPRISERICSGLRPFEGAAEKFPALQTHSSLGSLQQGSPRHPQVAQSKRGDESRRVFGKPFVANLRESELAFDDSEPVLYLGAHTGFELLRLVQQGAPKCVLVQRPAFTRRMVTCQSTPVAPARLVAP